MLILILIDIQCSQNAVFIFEKGSNCQNNSSSGSHHKVKNPPPPHSKIFKNPDVACDLTCVPLHTSLWSQWYCLSTRASSLIHPSASVQFELSPSLRNLIVANYINLELSMISITTILVKILQMIWGYVAVVHQSVCLFVCIFERYTFCIAIVLWCYFSGTWSSSH